jgi:hypothetical protein
MQLQKFINKLSNYQLLKKSLYLLIYDVFNEDFSSQTTSNIA